MNSCRYCKSNDVVELYPAPDIRNRIWYLFKCNTCNAYSLLPNPSPDDLKVAYDNSYYGKGINKFGFSIESFIDYFRKKKAKKLSKLISPNAKILDIGCGNGRFLHHFSSFGNNFELYGTEIEGGSAARAKSIKEINLRIGSVEELDFNPEFFDLITLIHVFEHLQNPEATLRVINKIIKKNGLLLISFPNISSWQSKIFKSNWYHLDPPRHLIFFSPTNFISMMEKIGFEMVSQKGCSFEQNPYGWIQSILNGLCKKREVLYERLKGNNTYAPEYTSLNIFFQKIFFIVLLPIFTIFDPIESFFKRSATVQFIFKKK